MDSRTADSLFGTDGDKSVDFFAQVQNPISPSQPAPALPQHSEPFAEKQHPPYEYNHSTEDAPQDGAYDPYGGQLRASPPLRTPSTARASIQRDSYTPQTNGHPAQNYAPPVAGPAPSTYSAPASQGAQYDPYAGIISRSTFFCNILSFIQTNWRV